MQNEQIIQESAKGLIDWFTQTASASEDFIIEQAPLYAQEVVAWAFWSGVIAAAIGSFVLVLCLAASLWVLWKAKSEDDESYLVMFLPIVVVVAVSLGVTAPLVSQAVKAHVAPRVVILEHVQQLVN